MTPAQLLTLKVAILNETDATLVAYREAGNQVGIARWYNEEAVPQIMLWKPHIDVAELLGAIIGTEFVNAGIANQNLWFALTQAPFVDATKAQIRNSFVAVFGPTSQSITNLSALAQRPATRFEALFAVANVSPVFGVQLGSVDIANALWST